MKNTWYWLVAALLSAAPVAAAPAAGLASAQAATPPKPLQTRYWRDRRTGRRYPLPSQIGGRPVAFYLTDPRVSPLAKALYTGRFRPSDSDSTTRLLALVTTKQADIRPFYRWCLDFTIRLSDGALGEYPGEPALRYASKFPQEFFAYMDKDTTGERYKSWVVIIAYSGLGSYDEATTATRKRITDEMKKNCHSCTDRMSKRISVFAKDVTRIQTVRW
jgi:hypothetical protein